MKKDHDFTYHRDDISEKVNLEGDLAIDTETMGLNINRDRLCLMQIAGKNNEAHLIHFINHEYNCPNLIKLLSFEGSQKIFHFARFDMAVIKKNLSIDIKNVFCTKIASRLIRTYTEHHSLKELCSELVGVKLSKTQQSSYWCADNLKKEQMDYAINDVIYLHKIRDILLEMMLKYPQRIKIMHKCFEFLSTIVDLDIMGWNDIDIFAHKQGRLKI